MDMELEDSNMTHYIDADKLIKSVNNYQEGAKAALNPIDGNADYYKGKIDACEDMKDLINSLQQKEPERICPRCVYHNKKEDFCECPYGGRDCFINENGIYKCNMFEEVEQQEQPEVQNGKFVFPKYLYARTKDNKTIDMSYAPQDMTAVEYIRNDFVEQVQAENEEKIMNFFDALGDCGFSQHDILLIKTIWKDTDVLGRERNE